MHLKKLLTAILSLMFVVVISSCDNQNKGTENQTVDAPAANIRDSSQSTNESVQSEQSVQAEGTQQTGQQNNAEITGQQIVDNISNKLNDKLNLSEEQFKNLTDVLTKRFTETGGDLNTKYPIETGKKMGRELRLKSAEQISSVLNAEQKEQYKKFINK